MAEKGSVKQSLLAVHLVYILMWIHGHSFTRTSRSRKHSSPISGEKGTHRACFIHAISRNAEGDSLQGLQYFSLEDEYKKLMIANTKLKEFTEELRKKYKNVQKQLEMLQMDTHTRSEERSEKADGQLQPIYTGISLYQVLFFVAVAFIIGVAISFYF